MGFTFAPAKDGEVIEPEQFGTLPPEVQARFRRDLEELQGRLLEALRAMPELQRRARERVKALQREVALAAAGHLVAELRLRYADLPEVLAHLDAVQDDVVEHLPDLVGASEGGGDVPPTSWWTTRRGAARRWSTRTCRPWPTWRGASTTTRTSARWSPTSR
jgi:hypothetical protein